MSSQILDDKLLKSIFSKHRNSLQDNFMFRVINQYKMGAQMFNRASILEKSKRSSAPKMANQLPQIDKQIKTIQSQTQVYQKQNKKQNVPSSVRVLSLKKQNSLENIYKNQLKTSQGKRIQLKQTKKNWYNKNYGPVQMKGVVFKKKNKEL